MKIKKRKVLDILQEQFPEKSEESLGKLALAGKIRIDGLAISSLHLRVIETAEVQIDEENSVVGRGELKLKGALDDLSLKVDALCCADLGSSTGGFTATLLKAGARKVYAVDTAYGELAYQLRCDERVVVLERTNVCALESFPEKIEFITIDISLLKLEVVLESLKKWIRGDERILALLKPQYQAQENELRDGEVLSSELKSVLERTLDSCESLGFTVRDIIASKVKGKSAGNQEFFVLLVFRSESDEEKFSFENFWQKYLADK